jgi:hypothetical protein
MQVLLFRMHVTDDKHAAKQIMINTYLADDKHVLYICMTATLAP